MEKVKESGSDAPQSIVKAAEKVSKTNTEELATFIASAEMVDLNKDFKSQAVLAGLFPDMADLLELGQLDDERIAEILKIDDDDKEKQDGLSPAAKAGVALTALAAAGGIGIASYMVWKRYKKNSLGSLELIWKKMPVVVQEGLPALGVPQNLPTSRNSAAFDVLKALNTKLFDLIVWLFVERQLRTAGKPGSIVQFESDSPDSPLLIAENTIEYNGCKELVVSKFFEVNKFYRVPESAKKTDIIGDGKAKKGVVNQLMLLDLVQPQMFDDKGNYIGMGLSSDPSSIKSAESKEYISKLSKLDQSPNWENRYGLNISSLNKDQVVGRLAISHATRIPPQELVLRFDGVYSESETRLIKEAFSLIPGLTVEQMVELGIVLKGEEDQAKKILSLIENSYEINKNKMMDDRILTQGISENSKLILKKFAPQLRAAWANIRDNRLMGYGGSISGIPDMTATVRRMSSRLNLTTGSRHSESPVEIYSMQLMNAGERILALHGGAP